MRQVMTPIVVEDPILNLLFADAAIKEELEQATKLKDPDEAAWALKDAQAQIHSLWDWDYPLAHSLAFERQVELDTIKIAPLAHNALFNGYPLCLGNHPKIPWAGYPSTDAERAEAGMIPTQNRKGLHLRRQRRQFPGPSILRIMG